MGIFKFFRSKIPMESKTIVFILRRNAKDAPTAGLKPKSTNNMLFPPSVIPNALGDRGMSIRVVKIGCRNKAVK